MACSEMIFAVKYHLFGNEFSNKNATHQNMN